MIHSSLLGDPTSPEGGTDNDARATIDDLDLARLDWIKIGDDQDAAAILAGAGDTLWRLRPRLFVGVGDERALRQVAGALRDFGYHCARVDTPLFDPGNFNRRTDDIFGGAVALAVVAIPEETSAGPLPPGLIALG
jgi:hypothetical protein